MTTDSVRAWIALMTVAIFMAITAFMSLFPLLAKANGELREYADFFVKIASIYTGILGVIVGYYFGRAHEAEAANGTPAGEPAMPTERDSGGLLLAVAAKSQIRPGRRRGKCARHAEYCPNGEAVAASTPNSSRSRNLTDTKQAAILATTAG